MSTHHQTGSGVPPLDLSKWRNLPNILIGVGAVGVGLGFALTDIRQFGFSWLVAFMFFLSLGIGAWFLVMAHHMFDASWSVPIRRVAEHLSCILFPTMPILFIPIAALATKMYPWMGGELQAHPDHALAAKYPLFTIPGFYVVSAFCFAVWGLFTNRLRYWSLQQDKSGSSECTFKMRRYTGFGIILFAITVTLAVIMWMKALMHEWASTMYAVPFFAACTWLTLATIYVIALVLQRTGHLRDVIKPKQYYFIGSLMFAFTVFYAYTTFSQYFIIWNANMPEETFYYVLREKGTWWDVGQIIIFGHFFLPFLMLLRIDWKLKMATMLPLCAWAWLMHFFDLQFQIVPSLHPDGLDAKGLALDAACMILFAGIVAKVFIHSFNSHPPFPQKDPRMAEGLDIYVPPASSYARAHE